MRRLCTTGIKSLTYNKLSWRIDDSKVLIPCAASDNALYLEKEKYHVLENTVSQRPSVMGKTIHFLWSLREGHGKKGGHFISQADLGRWTVLAHLVRMSPFLSVWHLGLKEATGWGCERVCFDYSSGFKCHAFLKYIFY